jgi:hypothetical protein
MLGKRHRLLSLKIAHRATVEAVNEPLFAELRDGHT